MAGPLNFIVKRWWWIVGVIAGLGLIAVGVLLALPKSSISPSVKSQLTSALLVPTGPGVQFDRESVDYDSTNKLLKFDVTYAGTSIQVTQQPSPEQFSSSPQLLDKTLQSAGTYQTFDTSLGKVYLTKPNELKGQQTAILNAKGTLCFARAAKNLSNEEWRVFFNRVDVEK